MGRRIDQGVNWSRMVGDDHRSGSASRVNLAARRAFVLPAKLPRMTEPTDDLDPIALFAITGVSEGQSLTEIAEALGMRVGAVFQRCVQTAELTRRYQMARETAADLLETELIDVVRNSTSASSKADRVKLAGLQWVLARRCPRRYADRVALEHSSPDGSMSPKEAVDMTKLSKEALDELMAARKPKVHE